MRTRIYAFILFMLLLPVLASAQWGGGKEKGPRILHRDTISSADTWMASAPTSYQSGAQDLNGYDNVRADFDVTGTGVSINCNLQCSNDAIWVSGDSITVTRDSYKSWSLGGCKNYYVYVEGVSSADTITVYLTPYNN